MCLSNQGSQCEYCILFWCHTMITVLHTLCAFKGKVLCFSMLKNWAPLICHNIQHKHNSNPLYRRVQINQYTLHFIYCCKSPNKGYSITAAKQCCFCPRAWNSLSFYVFCNQALPLAVQCTGMKQCQSLLRSRTKWGSARSEWGSNESLSSIQLNWTKQC